MYKLTSKRKITSHTPITTCKMSSASISLWLVARLSLATLRGRTPRHLRPVVVSVCVCVRVSVGSCRGIRHKFPRWWVGLIPQVRTMGCASDKYFRHAPAPRSQALPQAQAQSAARGVRRQRECGRRRDASRRWASAARLCGHDDCVKGLRR